MSDHRLDLCNLLCRRWTRAYRRETGGLTINGVPPMEWSGEDIVRGSVSAMRRNGPEYIHRLGYSLLPYARTADEVVCCELLRSYNAPSA